MADLEKRVSQLEREVQALKTRVQNTDAKVAATDEDLQGIPGLVKAEFRLIESRLSRVMAEFRTGIEERFDQRFGAMEQRFDALLRAVSEAIVERDKRR